MQILENILYRMNKPELKNADIAKLSKELKKNNFSENDIRRIEFQWATEKGIPEHLREKYINFSKGIF